MKTLRCIFFICITVSTILSGSATPQSSPVEEWQSLIRQKGNTLIFDVYEIPGSHWPKWPKREKDQEKNRQLIASSVIHDAQKLVQGMETSSEKQFWLRVNTCLHIRDDALKNADYVSLVLADALTRAIAVALCQELGREVVLSRQFHESLAKLHGFQLPVLKWCAIAHNEFGIKEESIVGVQRAATDEDAFKLLWRVISSNDDFGIPSNVEKSSSLNLLRDPNLTLLLHRVIRTDILVKTLVVAVDYKMRTNNFTIDDEEEKIATKISAPISQTRYSIRKDGVHKKDVPLDPQKYTLGERILGLQVSYPEVARLLLAIKCKSIDKQLFYDIPNTRTPQVK